MKTSSIRKKVTITEKHLEAALAVPWNDKTCLVAQALPFTTAELFRVNGHGAYLLDGRFLSYGNEKVADLMLKFDRLDGERASGYSDEAKKLEKKIRKALPVSFMITITNPNES